MLVEHVEVNRGPSSFALPDLGGIPTPSHSRGISPRNSSELCRRDSIQEPGLQSSGWEGLAMELQQGLKFSRRLGHSSPRTPDLFSRRVLTSPGWPQTPSIHRAALGTRTGHASSPGQPDQDGQGPSFSTPQSSMLSQAVTSDHSVTTSSAVMSSSLVGLVDTPLGTMVLWSDDDDDDDVSGGDGTQPGASAAACTASTAGTSDMYQTAASPTSTSGSTMYLSAFTGRQESGELVEVEQQQDEHGAVEPGLGGPSAQQAQQVVASVSAAGASLDDVLRAVHAAAQQPLQGVGYPVLVSVVQRLLTTHAQLLEQHKLLAAELSTYQAAFRQEQGRRLACEVALRKEQAMWGQERQNLRLGHRIWSDEPAVCTRCCQLADQALSWDAQQQAGDTSSATGEL